MNTDFFNKIEAVLSAERLDVYRQDGVPPVTALARYLWNMALCEALYSPLQIVEVALRNAIHKALTRREGSETWYDTIARLPPWQAEQVREVRDKLKTENKPETPGRVVAELHFGFWTGFFNGVHARTGIGYALTHQVLANAHRRQQDMKALDARLTRVRNLRNRVFHHERIIHWSDLDKQHAGMLELVGWISPELYEMTVALDRFARVREAGVGLWIEKLRRHWPDPSRVPDAATPTPGIVCVGGDCAVNNVETPFGKRWDSASFDLGDSHLDDLLSGLTLALDVRNEYVVYLRHVSDAAGGAHAERR